MAKKLEEIAAEAPIFVLSERTEIQPNGDGFTVTTNIRSNKQVEVWFQYDAINAIYNSKGELVYEKLEGQSPIIRAPSESELSNVPGYLSGAQIVFTDKVTYRGFKEEEHEDEEEPEGSIRFSIERDGVQIRHARSRPNAPLNIPYSGIDAVLDSDGKMLWENPDRTPEE